MGINPWERHLPALVQQVVIIERQDSSFEAPDPTCIMAYSPQDVYARHLVSGRGYPLWTPEPNMNLPDSYVREGLKIGDVGVVVPTDGSFDVFFNVCLPQTHSLHRETGVPENFTPIALSGRDIAKFPEAESAGRIISSVARVRDTDAPQAASDVEDQDQERCVVSP